MPSPLTDQLLNWYKQHARTLPWRGQTDPYAVWVSEIMLQQTRVETVAPYYRRWMERFPTVQALAEASQQEILSAWEGLGYYSRARNLHRAAQMIMARHEGKIPAGLKELQALPGVGRYTAGAIASIAFGQDQPAVDGNIRRVLARVFNVTEPVHTPAADRRFWELAQANLPPGRASEYNQALMDLGATICTPRSPDCPRCPLEDLCQARALGVQEERPVARRKMPTPHYVVTAAVIEQAGEVLITQRPVDGLLGGMWEFPGGKIEPGEDLPSCLQREIQEELAVQVHVGEPLGVYQHAYTHFRVTLHAFRCTLANGSQPQPVQVQALRWVKPAELPAFPMGKIDRQIAARVIQVANEKNPS